ncbi:MAG: bifunctional 5,10-methylenetetrahydrofolate dehydrogenase/5,10-methenyltetrahydrofolate cyclohydrolase [Suipraeoptans sp.]
MSELLKGAEVVEALKAELSEQSEQLIKKGIIPRMEILRVGERPDDLYYERSAIKRMESVNIQCHVTILPMDVNQELLVKTFRDINDNPKIHGILLFRPLPEHLDETPLKEIINPYKDIDSMSPINAAKVFIGDESGYAPCTPEAVIDILDYYNIELEGKNVVVIGRSMVVGKPLSMLLVKRNATVTICHTRTKNLAKVCSEADILIAAAGKAKMISRDMVGVNSIVIDVGINVDDDGKLCGDVDFDDVQDKVRYISPVPGGVGGVTSMVLAKHVIRGTKYFETKEL